MNLPFTQHIKYLFICHVIFFVDFTLTIPYNVQYILALYDSHSGLNSLSGFGSFYDIYGGIDGFNGLYGIISISDSSSASLQLHHALLILATTTNITPGTTPIAATPMEAILITII